MLLMIRRAERTRPCLTGRTFIMPDQRTRELSVRRKLNAMRSVFNGKKVLLVDDSIVRGTTMTQIVQMCRNAGAVKVYLASAAPPVKHPNVYGVDMPSRHEFVVRSPVVAYNVHVSRVSSTWVSMGRITDLGD
jgi:glutamine phosphoribosylpyrophosphate amidotransferase